MFSTIKTYLVAALAVAVGVLAALWQYSRASHANDKLDGEKAAREVENNANEKMVECLNEEAKIQADNNTDRKSFLD